MSGWQRQEPLVASAGDVGGDVQASDAFDARWSRQLDDGTFGLISRVYYVADVDGAVFLECQTEYLICTDLSDPGSTELQADYRYRRVAGELSPQGAYQAAEDAPEPDDEEWLAALAAMS